MFEYKAEQDTYLSYVENSGQCKIRDSLDTKTATRQSCSTQFVATDHTQSASMGVSQSQIFCPVIRKSHLYSQHIIALRQEALLEDLTATMNPYHGDVI